MSENFSKEIIPPLAGLAAIEVGPKVAANVFEELQGATGGSVEFMSEEIANSDIGKFFEGGVEAIQNIALPVATLCIICGVLYKMLNRKEKH